MARPTRITAPERRAAQIYATMVKPNQSQAYLLSGLKYGGNNKKSLEQIACRMFNKPQVKKYLQGILEKGRQAAIDAVAISESEVLSELKVMAFAKVADFYDVDDGALTLKAFDEVDTRPLSTIKQRKTTFGKDGEGQALTTEIKLEKFNALVKLGEYLGLFKQDQEHGRPVNVYIDNRLHYKTVKGEVERDTISVQVQEA
jgi:hypothetical protein